jgi:predicted RNase H-like HicB family nuclease
MGLPDSYEFGETLDKVFESLLENMKVLHEAKIVHRDCKYS